jgi:hypothetical protein
MDFEAAANALFPSMAQPSPEAQPSAQLTDQQKAEKLFSGPTPYVSPFDPEPKASPQPKAQAPAAEQPASASTPPADISQAVEGLDELSAQHVSEAAKALGLSSPEQVSQMLELHSNFVEQQAAQWHAASEQEFSNEDKQLAAAVMKHVADEELIDWLNHSGMGNHPGLIRMVVKLGHALAQRNGR